MKRCLPALAAVLLTARVAHAEPAPDAPAPEKKWYDILDVGAFVDAYYSQNWRQPRPNAGANLFQPYTPTTGFNLSWVGLDASVAPDPVGATLQLRFGPSVPNLALGDFGIPGGIGFVQNGFVSWKPTGKDGPLTLTFGKFDTVYGAEVTQSQLNINYTRGYLYNLAQPFFHTGFRAEYQATDMITVKALAVNGWNDTIDNNRGKSFGAQVVVAPRSNLQLAAGWLGGPEENDVNTVTCRAGEVFDRGTSTCVPGAGGATSGTARNVGADSRWRHLFDVVGDLTIRHTFRVVVNADYVTETISVLGHDRTASWYGAAALLRYQLSTWWAVAARGEIIRDADGQITAPNTAPVTLETGTLTLELAPHKMLLLRLDNRVDAADRAIFPSNVHGSARTQLTSTLGVVARTN